MDAVPPQSQVCVLDGEALEAMEIKTIEEAKALYMDMYRRQFSVFSVTQRERYLKRFLRYLKSEKHSMMLSDITYGDGQAFIDTFGKLLRRLKLSLAVKQDYRGTLRSLSQFLSNSRIID